MSTTTTTFKTQKSTKSSTERNFCGLSASGEDHLLKSTFLGSLGGDRMGGIATLARLVSEAGEGREAADIPTCEARIWRTESTDVSHASNHVSDAEGDYVKEDTLESEKT